MTSKILASPLSLCADVHVDSDRQQEDGNEGEVDDCVDHDRQSAGLKVAELHELALPRQLDQQPRRQQDEEHHRDEHRSPVRHLPSSNLLPIL
ncbi:unnamed protein product [Spirodela intermedia]|uniref:Uncharacterized protein n=1 Tax=Spirodela intermedia TaxID=51605 RepID=A0A7I8L421_SPIIN|nr:unnamed protein product [Spirodela intermedia]